MDGTLTGSTILSQSGLRSNINEAGLEFYQLIIPRTPVGRGYPSAVVREFQFRSEYLKPQNSMIIITKQE